jgi:glutamine amidotransferase
VREVKAGIAMTGDETMAVRIAIVDYGAGNIGSVSRALSYLGAEPFLAKAPGDLEKADAIVLPGVGSFSCAENLSGMKKELLLQMQKKPFLGICLGMQLLFEASEEAEGKGLCIYPGRIGRLECKKVPHVGWNTIEACGAYGKRRAVSGSFASQNAAEGYGKIAGGAGRKSRLLAGVWDEAFYFCHSYAVKECEDATAKTAVDGKAFVSAIERGSMCAVQFHSEKSGRAGLQVLKNFISMVRK